MPKRSGINSWIQRSRVGSCHAELCGTLRFLWAKQTKCGNEFRIYQHDLSWIFKDCMQQSKLNHIWSISIIKKITYFCYLLFFVSFIVDLLHFVTKCDHKVFRSFCYICLLECWANREAADGAQRVQELSARAAVERGVVELWCAVICCVWDVLM